jgi:hypothetical protein
MMDSVKAGMEVAYEKTKEAFIETREFLHVAKEKAMDNYPEIKEKVQAATAKIAGAVSNIAG